MTALLRVNLCLFGFVGIVALVPRLAYAPARQAGVTSYQVEQVLYDREDSQLWASITQLEEGQQQPQAAAIPGVLAVDLENGKVFYRGKRYQGHDYIMVNLNREISHLNAYLALLYDAVREEEQKKAETNGR